MLQMLKKKIVKAVCNELSTMQEALSCLQVYMCAGLGCESPCLF